MILRRTILKLGMMLPAALGLPAGARAEASDFDALVVDHRFSLLEPMPDATQLFTVAGDVTTLWYETLDPHWRQPGFVVAGYTGTDILFVLEHLAWDRGRRVVERRMIENGGDGRPPLVYWVIAPVHPSATPKV